MGSQKLTDYASTARELDAPAPFLGRCSSKLVQISGHIEISFVEREWLDQGGVVGEANCERSCPCRLAQIHGRIVP